MPPISSSISGDAPQTLAPAMPPKSSSISGEDDQVPSDTADDSSCDTAVKPLASSDDEGETEEEEEEENEGTTSSGHPRRRSSRILSTKPPTEEKQQRRRQSATQRVWSDEDEIAILRGLVNYRAENGTVPSGLSHMDAFLAFIRKSLQIKEEVKKSQINDKIRRLKRKYRALRARSRGRRLSFIKPHDETLYELSYKVWGTAEEGGASNASGNGNASAVTKTKLRKRAKDNGDVPVDNGTSIGEKKRKRKRTKIKEAADVEENGDASAGKKKKKTNEYEVTPSNEVDSVRVVKKTVSYPFLMDAITRAGMMTHSDAVKRGLELADPSKTRVLEERFKRVRLLEIKNHLRRSSLIKESVKLALKSLENEG